MGQREPETWRNKGRERGREKRKGETEQSQELRPYLLQERERKQSQLMRAMFGTRFPQDTQNGDRVGVKYSPDSVVTIC